VMVDPAKLIRNLHQTKLREVPYVFGDNSPVTLGWLVASTHLRHR
jgi:hypothetical protein